MSILPGIDYAWSKPSISAIKAAGEVFVMQYFSPDQAKNLTPARAKDLQAAGIQFGVVWEYYADQAKKGRAQGVKDATDAQTQARACGVGTIPIYFAVDYDAPPGDQPAISAYFDGVASVIGLPRTGVYGGYWPVSRLRSAKKIHFTWGTVAWSGNQWAIADWKPHIMQGAYVKIGGVTCDLDAANSQDFGQWPRPKDVKHWGPWETKGKRSLQEVADVTDMNPAHILRATCSHNNGHWDDVTYRWLNSVFAGRYKATDPIPSGATLWVLR